MARKGSPAHTVTIHDVATAAGVAPMTVSRALSGNGYVGTATRDRVLAAARRLNYQPNALARSLRSRSTRTIGILLPDIANPYASELMRGIEEVVSAEGYVCFIAASLRDVERETSALAAFVNHQVDGLLVATRETREGNRALHSAVARGVRAVTVGRHSAHRQIDHVTANHWQGAFDAVSHLVSLGHRRIGFLGISFEQGPNLRRFQGYNGALMHHGLDLNPAWVDGPAGESPAYSTQEDGFTGMTRLLKLRRRPTAVLCRNDYTAIGAIRAAQDAGLDVPSDIAVAGFDNIPISAYTHPPLTTVEQPVVEQGAAAGRMLIERLTGKYDGPRREAVHPCRLIVRRSCGAECRA